MTTTKSNMQLLYRGALMLSKTLSHYLFFFFTHRLFLSSSPSLPLHFF